MRLCSGRPEKLARIVVRGSRAVIRRDFLTPRHQKFPFVPSAPRRVPLPLSRLPVEGELPFEVETAILSRP